MTDRGSEYCGTREYHEYQLYLTIEGIDHTKTRAKSPQTNGICERLHRTILDEFYQVAFSIHPRGRWFKVNLFFAGETNLRHQQECVWAGDQEKIFTCIRPWAEADFDG